MSVTEKGVIGEVNELLADFRLAEVPTQVELTADDILRAEYATTTLHGELQDPTLRGVKIGMSMVSVLSGYAARHAQVDANPMYRLATQESARSIASFRPVMPERVAPKSRVIRFTPQAAVNALANHSLWLASQDTASRRKIPEALEKRLEASKKYAPQHLAVVVRAGITEAADIAASVRSFESKNGIKTRGSNVAGFAVYGYSLGEYQRLSRFIDIVRIGR